MQLFRMRHHNSPSTTDTIIILRTIRFLITTITNYKAFLFGNKVVLLVFPWLRPVSCQAYKVGEDSAKVRTLKLFFFLLRGSMGALAWKK